jgi:glutathione reductase (NADPH)
LSDAADFDLFVIGAGSGGVRAARVAAGLGARVAIAEEHRAGGTCVIRGCIPKKLLVYAAHFREELEDARGFGWTAGASFDWTALREAKDREVARLEAVYRRLLDESGVHFLSGRAVVRAADTVEVDGRTIRARHLLIATGARPERPQVPGIEHAITSEEAFQLDALPRRVLVVGGGYVALEFAGIFHGLGSTVEVAHRGPRVLRGFDEELAEHLQAQLRAKGIALRLHCSVLSIARRSDGRLTVEMRDDAVQSTREYDAVMYATGRRPNTRGLGLEEAGVRLDAHGAVAVDAWSQSSVSGVHAVGDVTARLALTPVAIREGAALAQTLFGRRPTAVDHRNVPHAVFSQPPVGTVGLGESEARAALPAVRVYRASFKPLKHTLSGRDERTLVKLVVDGSNDRVVGVHMVGADAPEIVQGLAIAVKAGLSKAQFDETVALHPTAAEEFVTLRGA